MIKQLWDRGRIYKAHRVVPYSWKLTTPLSNLEATSNYQDIQDPAITVRFKLEDDLDLGGAVYVLAWTTTPRARMSGAPFNPSASCARFSMGRPWQSQPKRRST